MLSNCLCVSRSEFVAERERKRETFGSKDGHGSGVR